MAPNRPTPKPWLTRRHSSLHSRLFKHSVKCHCCKQAVVVLPRSVSVFFKRKISQGRDVTRPPDRVKLELEENSQRLTDERGERFSQLIGKGVSTVVNEQKPIEIHLRGADRRQTQMESVEKVDDVDEETSLAVFLLSSEEERVSPRQLHLTNIEKKEKEQQARLPGKNLRVGESEREIMTQREKQRREMNHGEIFFSFASEQDETNEQRKRKTKPMERSEEDQEQLKRQISKEKERALPRPHRSTRDERFIH